MRVLLVHKFHQLTGGAEVFYFDVARILKKNGHVVSFFTTESSENIRTDDKVYTVPAPNYTNNSLIGKLKNSRDIFYSKDKKHAFSKAIQEFQPDIIHVFAIHVQLTPAILEAAKELSVPVLMSCNDYKHICPNYKIYDGAALCEKCKGYKFYNAVLQKCCKGSMTFSIASAIEAYVHEYYHVYDDLVDRYLFASQFMLNKTKEFWVNKNVNYGVLRNPFDISGYSPVYKGDYALYFGRIIDEKGVHKIIEASRLTNVPIKIVGDGPDLIMLQKEVKKYKLDHVEFLGPIWGGALDKILYDARYVIVPSLWHENFPYVIFQAFAAGKPVIGSTRGGIPELIGQDRGILFDPNNVEELAAGLTRLWDDVEMCRYMGKKARKYVVEEFSDDAFYESLIGNYQEVLK